MKGFAEGHEFGGKGGRGAGLLDAHEFVFELGSSFLVFVNGREFFKAFESLSLIAATVWQKALWR